MNEIEKRLSQLHRALTEKADRDSLFRAQLLIDPTIAVEELTGHPLPNGVSIRAYEDVDGRLYLALPFNPVRSFAL